MNLSVLRVCVLLLLGVRCSVGQSKEGSPLPVRHWLLQLGLQDKDKAAKASE
jgi:hypothetical protein